MQINDNDIDDIKNDISIIKNNIDTLSLEFKKHIQEHLTASSVTQNDSVTTNLLVNSENKSDASIIISSLDTYAVENKTETILNYDNKSIHNDLIDSSFIDKNHKNKLLIEIISNSDKNICSLYKNNFLEFCRSAVGLVEDIIKIFLEKNFIDIEEDNHPLLKACDLLEIQYKNKNGDFPNIYISKNKYNIYKNKDTKDYYYNSNREEYLSLSNLKETKIIFTLELCFIRLYGEGFYKKTDIKTRSPNVKTSSKAVERPLAKLASSLEPLKKGFYERRNHAREFRNIFEHNPNNGEAQQKKLKEKISKYKKLADDLDNYDGILEAVNWFIRQMYIAMKK